jgi:hypothetical protein
VRLPDFPDGLDREIKGAFEAGKTVGVVLVSAMGHDQIVSWKEEQESKA